MTIKTNAVACTNGQTAHLQWNSDSPGACVLFAYNKGGPEQGRVELDGKYGPCVVTKGVYCIHQAEIDAAIAFIKECQAEAEAQALKTCMVEGPVTWEFGRDHNVCLVKIQGPGRGIAVYERESWEDNAFIPEDVFQAARRFMGWS